MLLWLLPFPRLNIPQQVKENMALPEPIHIFWAVFSILNGLYETKDASGSVRRFCYLGSGVFGYELEPMLVELERFCAAEDFWPGGSQVVKG